MATKTTPIFASSFLRQSSLLHGSMIKSDSKMDKMKEYHWYNTDIINTNAVTFATQSSDLNKEQWLQLLSLISTRFIQVSWRILHDLQIAPPSNALHLYNHDEWVMVEILYRGIKTVSCIQTIKDNKLDPISIMHNNDDDNPLIHFSPLIITDLHLQFTLDPNHASLISLNSGTNKIGLRSIDFHNFPIAKVVRFQVLSSLAYDDATNYNKIVTKYMLENKVNDIELMKDDYYVHHKCIWKTAIVAIPIIHNPQNNKTEHKPLRGRAALKHFYLNKRKSCNAADAASVYSVTHWIYIQIMDVVSDTCNNLNEERQYFRILPTVTAFIQMAQNGNDLQPRLCEYYSSILLNCNQSFNGNNLFYHYKIPIFYEKMVQNVLFPNICAKYCDSKYLILKNIHVNPSFLMIANKGHRLGANLRNMCSILGLNYIYKNCIQLLGANMSATVHLMSTFLNSTLKYRPFILHLDCLHLFEFEANIHSFYNTSGKIKPILPIVNALQQFISHSQHNKRKIIIFAEANNITKITRELRSIFTYEHILESIFDDEGKCETEIIPACVQSHISCLNLINGLNTTQLFEMVGSPSADYQQKVDNIRWRQSLYNINLNINVSSIPCVQWQDVGGLESAKQEILNIIKLPLQYSHVFASIKQSIGILLYGPPGTGKTLLAKAIATEFKMNFISIKGPELLNPYVGQSEENIRNVFSKAVQSRPCILFFDEIDALVPSRGNSSDGGNVMDRVVSQLLTEIDGVSNKYNGEIFIIAATNRPDLLDASLLRPKRLDKQIYLGVPQKTEDKLKIIRALTRKFTFNESEKQKMQILREISKNKAIELFTGADLYALCCDAMMYATKLLIKDIEALIDENSDLSVDLFMELIQNEKRKILQEKYKIKMSDEQWNKIKDFSVKLELDHFQKALINIKPSLSQSEILKYQSIHRQQVEK